jgi:hypothetical protein
VGGQGWRHPRTNGPFDRDNLALNEIRAEIDLLRGEVEMAAERLGQIRWGAGVEDAGELGTRITEVAVWAGRPDQARARVRSVLDRLKDTEWVICAGGCWRWGRVPAPTRPNGPELGAVASSGRPARGAAQPPRRMRAADPRPARVRMARGPRRGQVALPVPDLGGGDDRGHPPWRRQPGPDPPAGAGTVRACERSGGPPSGTHA